MTMVPVRFIRPRLPYGVDEVAGFSPVEARRLVERGLAVLLEPPAEVSPAAEIAEAPPLPRRRGRPPKS